MADAGTRRADERVVVDAPPPGVDAPQPAVPTPPTPPGGLTAPFRSRIFRSVWGSGVVSNLGTQIQAVAAAWAMTSLTRDAQTVAAVQTASMLPIMLFALFAGTLADLFDRRRVALAALALSLTGAAGLALMSFLDALTPAVILLLCFTVGVGAMLFAPAWQASVREQVPAADMPAAIALNAISYNVGRSIGPAVGGVIVATAGATAAFCANALSFAPIMLALYAWRRVPPPATGPRERLGHAVSLGIAYIVNTPTMRLVLVRVLLNALAGGAILGLLPIVAKWRLAGSALVYGSLLGAFGIGAILGAALLPAIRRRYPSETIIRGAGAMMGGCLLIVGLSRTAPLTALALLPIGVGWTLAAATFNVAIQLSAPRWVAGRALSAYQAAMAGGAAVGSWFWGGVAGGLGIAAALSLAGAYLIAIQAVGLRWPMPATGEARDDAPDPLPDPETRVPIRARSGPVTVTVDYRIVPGDVAQFRALMQEARRIRKRNGAGGWTLAHDLIDPGLWVERFQFGTWGDYVRFRHRPTMAERRLFGQIRALHKGGDKPTIRRLLERPSETIDASDAHPGTAEPMPWVAP